MRDGGNGGGKKPKWEFTTKHQSIFIVVCASFWLCDVLDILGIVVYKIVQNFLGHLGGDWR